MIDYSAAECDILHRIERVIIENEQADTDIVKSFLRQKDTLLKEDIEIIYIDSFHEFYKENQPFLKRSDLFLVKNQGEYLKICPGTKNYVCCGYWVLDIGNNCLYDCQYCILQCYFPVRSQIIYTNQYQIDEELRVFYKQNPHRRLGTGEFTDSLLFEPLTNAALPMVERFREFPEFFIEFKSKSIFVKDLLDVDSNQVILSWSLNTDFVVENYELNTPSIDRRLEVASIAAQQGRSLSFHFDPIIYYPDWFEGYQSTIKRLFDAIDPRFITYISLGCFRYIPDLKKYILENNYHCPFVLEDYIQAKDDKMRYFYDRRKKIFSEIIRMIRERAPHLTVYFCMESQDLWKDCFGHTMSYSELDKILYQSCVDVQRFTGGLS